MDKGSQRQRILGLLRRHGWNATSFQVIEQECRYWFNGGGEAAVAYVDTGRAWVVAGAPIAALERCAEVVRRFGEEAGRHGRGVVFFATEPRFLRCAAPMRSLAIGEQPSWNPRLWGERHRGHRGLKEQLRRARAKGVTVERVPSDVAAGAMRPRLERLIRRWLAARAMPPMAFLVALEPFAFAGERRYYAARAADRIVGLLIAVPVYGRNGWFLENILRDPAAPNGTTELLIDAAMRDAAAEDCDFVTLGLAPLAGTEPWQRVTRRLLRGFYNFEGLRAFKAKLRPDQWTPIFLAWPGDETAAWAVLNVLLAFAGGRPVRFALRTLLRAPAPVLFALGALLVPWTILLALADTERWFGSRREQLGWVAFDALMAAALLSLSRRWRRPLAAVACAAAFSDGAITAATAVRRGVRWKDGMVIAAAVTAPFLAGAILLGGLRRAAPPV